MKKFLMLLLALLPAAAWAGDKDDFGTWFSLGAEKVLPRNTEIGLEAGLRTRDNSSIVDRWSVGLNFGYKPSKYFKFGFSYNLLDGYRPEKWQRKDRFGKDEWGEWYPVQNEIVTGSPLNDSHDRVRTRFTETFWKPRHRFSLEATGTIKFWKLIRFSLRERYQYTFHPEQEVDRSYYTYKWQPDYSTGDYFWAGGFDEEKTEEKGAKLEAKDHSHILRSRLKIEWDKKRCPWSPYVSVESHNDLRHSFDLTKIRAAVGTDYKINQHHSVSAAYIFTNDTEEQTERIHAISIGYNYKF